MARVLAWRPAPKGEFAVAIVAAGTADWPVAAEARAVAASIGLAPTVIADVGVAGLDRVLSVRASSTPPTLSSWSPGWRARSPASSAASSAAP